MADIIAFDLESITTFERCLGHVRWVTVPHLQDPKLQQLWEIATYKDGKPWSREEQWRDVPTDSNIAH